MSDLPANYYTDAVNGLAYKSISQNSILTTTAAGREIIRTFKAQSADVILEAIKEIHAVDMFKEWGSYVIANHLLVTKPEYKKLIYDGPKTPPLPKEEPLELVPTCDLTSLNDPTNLSNAVYANDVEEDVADMNSSMHPYDRPSRFEDENVYLYRGVQIDEPLEEIPVPDNEDSDEPAFAVVDVEPYTTVIAAAKNEPYNTVIAAAKNEPVVDDVEVDASDVDQLDSVSDQVSENVVVVDGVIVDQTDNQVAVQANTQTDVQVDERQTPMTPVKTLEDYEKLTMPGTPRKLLVNHALHGVPKQLKFDDESKIYTLSVIPVAGPVPLLVAGPVPMLTKTENVAWKQPGKSLDMAKSLDVLKTDVLKPIKTTELNTTASKTTDPIKDKFKAAYNVKQSIAEHATHAPGKTAMFTEEECISNLGAPNTHQHREGTVTSGKWWIPFMAGRVPILPKKFDWYLHKVDNEGNPIGWKVVQYDDYGNPISWKVNRSSSFIHTKVFHNGTWCLKHEEVVEVQDADGNWYKTRHPVSVDYMTWVLCPDSLRYKLGDCPKA